MLDSIDSRELGEWIAFDRISPIGDWRGDLHAGIVASTLANIHRGKNQPVASPLDFMPFRDPEPEPSQEDMAKALIDKIKGAERGRNR